MEGIMTSESDTKITLTDIRRQAEEMLKGKGTDLKTLSATEGQSLLHELQVHQIELEMQNEELRRTQKELQEARIYTENIIETVREPLVALDKNLKVLSANQSFYSTFKVTPDETVGNLIYDIGNRQWDIPSLRTLLEEILPEKTQFNDYEVSHKFETIGQKIMLLNARQISQEVIGTPIILLAIEDITERKSIEKKLELSLIHISEPTRLGMISYAV